jgi:phage terminase large subunit
MCTEKDSIFETSAWNVAEIKVTDFCKNWHFKVQMYFFERYQHLTFQSVAVIIKSTKVK